MQGTYTYDNRYVFAGTANYEGSNQLGRSRSARWLPTWNVSGRWNASNESFLKDNTKISNLAFRVSYGLIAGLGAASNALAVFKNGVANRYNIGDRENIIEIDKKTLKKISFLQNPKDSIAVCELPEISLKNKDFNIVLDGIQDPGNLGTIIRLADWFGIEQVVCSEDTVDCFNPKVIQATMGSFTRVNIVYTDLTDFLSTSQNTNVGADMRGENIYTADFPTKINLVMGNEGNGLRKTTEQRLHRKMSIPRFGRLQSTESLNVSIATSIILGEIFSRR